MSISSFIKYQRKKQGFTQQDLALKAGVGLRFVRELEQGKETLQLDKVQQVLGLFGFVLNPARQAVDAYDIFWNYLNKAVKIVLTDKTVRSGLILKEVRVADEIVAWQFLPGNSAIVYSQKQDENLTETILHKNIQTIENQ